MRRGGKQDCFSLGCSRGGFTKEVNGNQSGKARSSCWERPLEAEWTGTGAGTTCPEQAASRVAAGLLRGSSGSMPWKSAVLRDPGNKWKIRGGGGGSRGQRRPLLPSSRYDLTQVPQLTQGTGGDRQRTHRSAHQTTWHRLRLLGGLG